MCVAEPLGLIVWDAFFVVGGILLFVWILGLLGIYIFPTASLFHLFLALAILCLFSWIFMRFVYPRRRITGAAPTTTALV